MPKAAVTIGNFDGVHAGHKALIQHARQAVGRQGRVIAIAFDPHPSTRLAPDRQIKRLTSFDRRETALHAAGVDHVVKLDPAPALLNLSPDQFIAAVVADHKPDVFVEGTDFRFGAKRAGNLDTLRHLGQSHSFEVLEVSPVQIALRDQSIVTASSSITRWLLDQGRVRDAALVLGRPFELRGTVTQGDQRGRQIGVPTSNLELPHDHAVPGPGVYAAIAHLPGTPALGYAAAVNIGSRPTFDGNGIRIEAHLLRDDNAIQGDPQAWTPLPGRPEYGWQLSLDIISRIRDEVRFESIDLLKAQLDRDIQHVATTIGPVTADRTPALEHAPEYA